MDDTLDTFLIAFLEGNKSAHGMLNHLILERIESRLVEKLADHYRNIEEEEFPERHADDDTNKKCDDDCEDKEGEVKNFRPRKKKKVVLGGKTEIDRFPETSTPDPKTDGAPVESGRKVSEGLLSAMTRHFIGKLASNAGIDPKIAAAITHGAKRKPPTVKKVARPEKQKSALKPDKPKAETKSETHVTAEPEKIDRKEFAKKLQASGNRLDRMSLKKK
jgi:hypothetical protein